MGLRELIDAFSIERVLEKSSVFDVSKLEWLNGRYLAEKPAAELAPLVTARLMARGVEPAQLAGREGWFHHLLDLLKVRARTTDEIATQALGYLRDEPTWDEDAVRKHWGKDPAGTGQLLEALRQRFADSSWDAGALEAALRGLAEERGVGAGKLIHPLRVALTGQGASPGIFDVLVVLGKERSLARIDGGIRRLGSEGAFLDPPAGAD
jgi:glutamyl-tRNA synthetase